MKLENILEDKIIALNQKNFLLLKDKMITGKTTWVLGAGISVPAGLPQWGTLLSKMWARLYEITPRVDNDIIDKAFLEAHLEKLNSIKEPSEFRGKVNAAYKGEYQNLILGINLLESAEYMWNYIDDLIGNRMVGESKKKLKGRILKALIRESLSINMTKEELIKCLKNQAMGYLVELLKEQKKGRIITYNYDNILEMCFQEMAKLTEKEVSVVCDCDLEKEDKEQKINIHHPHGALKIVDTVIGKESENIILTESSYYEMERKAYNWENSVQAKALVESSCIFMGFSGEDYNFRRIIKNIDFKPEEDEPKHFIFICLDDLIKNVYGDEWINCQEERFLYEGIQVINRLYAQYSYWRRHGVIPIWSTFDELPEMVNQLRA